VTSESPQGTFTSASTVPLGHYLLVLRRHALLITALVALSVASALAYSLTQPTTYMATAEVLVQRYTAGSSIGSTTPTEADMATEAQLVASAPVADSVRRTLQIGAPRDVLLSNLSVEQVGTSAFLAVNYASSDPATAVAVANAFSRSFVAFRDLDTKLPGTAQLIEPAAAPVAASAAIVRDVVLSLAAGLVVAVLLAFVVERIQDRARSDDEVASVIGAPVLAEIPVRTRPPSPRAKDARESTPYGFLSAHLQLAATPGSSTVVLVTTPYEGDGKTTVTANIALALTGRLRVIAVSADPHLPHLHTLLGAADDHGLTDVFRADGRLDQAIDSALQPTVEANLRVLAYGADRDGPPVAKGMWSEVLEHLRSQADVIVLDGPPILTTPTASVLAAFADSTLFVIRAGRAEKRGILARAAAAVRTAGGHIIGLVRIRERRRPFRAADGD
jgi:Mrp family chromosome partitioning ATPase